MTRFLGLTPMLKTRDLGATVEFYTRFLGFTVAKLHPGENPTLAFLDRGNIHLAFYVDTERREGDPAATGQFYFEVDGVLDLHARVKDHAEIQWGPEVYSYGMREFAVRDPNGYILSFGEETTDPPDCPEP